jgi:hypothetical protein
MKRTIEFIRKSDWLEEASGSTLAVPLSVEEAVALGPDQVELVVDGEVLDRDGELALREELIREERGRQVGRRSWLERLVSTLTPALSLGGRESRGAFMASRAKSIDVAGRYQPYVDFEKLLEVDGWWIKGVEVDDTSNPDGWLYPNALEFLDRVYRLKKPAIMYVFVNTAIWLRRQVDEAKLKGEDNLPDAQRAQAYIENDPQIRAILRQFIVGESWLTDWTKVKAAPKRAWTTVALDSERYWMDYNDWYANGANCKKVGDFWIFFTVKTLYERLEWLMMRGYLPKCELIYNYTGYWFTSQYSPMLGDWLSTKPNWLAAYYWPAGSVKTVWAEIVKLLDAIPDTWRPSKVFNKLPEVIQISGDRFIIPEIRNSSNVPRTFDVNLHWQTKDEWYKALGFNQVVDPPPVPPVPPVTDPTLKELQAQIDVLKLSQAAQDAKIAALEARPVMGAHTHDGTVQVGPAKF